ncbi:LysM peptidoglycan-binding domain-containing protein [Virgibacillus sp. W0181]|uniref:C40 family peptidase n=1 Tax=Virgibacillus sp. W0181 TaxID=3391581 RepID=UPI003F46F8B8
MSSKKIVMSVSASAVIASAFVAAEQAEAAAYKVKSGDSLWTIAQKHHTSVAQLKSLNKLSSDIIFPNQVLQTDGDSGSRSSGASSNNSQPADSSGSSDSSNSISDGNTYTVKSGDTLSAIAFKHNVSIANLMKWNNLNSTLIYPGNKFVVSGSGSGSGSGSNGGSSSSSGNDSASSGGGSSNSGSSGSSYTVVAGDSLSKIGAKYGVSVANLKKWNNLRSDLILVGQKLKVGKAVSSGSNGGNADGGSSSNSGSNSGSSSGGSSSSDSSTSVYTVKSGDSLSRIASNYKVSVANLKKWNNLSSDLIHIGQKLSINGQASGGSSSGGSGSSVEKPSTDVNYNVSQLVNIARSVLGTPYTWGGQSTSGFDCSGFIHYAYNKAGMSMTRKSTTGYFNRSYYIDNPKLGDLVFFKNTYRSGISHMGIYLGNNQFIHAGSSTGVTISNLDNSYWKKHYDGFKRFY